MIIYIILVAILQQVFFSPGLQYTATNNVQSKMRPFAIKMREPVSEPLKELCKKVWEIYGNS